VIEFFDEDEKVQSILQSLTDIVPKHHTLTFDANLS